MGSQPASLPAIHADRCAARRNTDSDGESDKGDKFDKKRHIAPPYRQPNAVRAVRDAAAWPTARPTKTEDWADETSRMPRQQDGVETRDR